MNIKIFSTAINTIKTYGSAKHNGSREGKNRFAWKMCGLCVAQHFAYSNFTWALTPASLWKLWLNEFRKIHMKEVKKNKEKRQRERERESSTQFIKLIDYIDVCLMEIFLFRLLFFFRFVFVYNICRIISSFVQFYVEFCWIHFIVYDSDGLFLLFSRKNIHAIIDSELKISIIVCYQKLPLFLDKRH